jgi:hypothetical protein
VARAEAAVERARALIALAHGPGHGRNVDEERARAALLRAINRLTVARKRG